MKPPESSYPLEYRRRYFQSIQETEFTDLTGKRLDEPDWLSSIVDSLIAIRSSKKSVYFIGNGASASIASHYASDMTKNGNLKAHSLHDGALMTCFANDYSYATAFEQILTRYFENGDALFAISSSGKSENIVRATELAKQRSPENVFTLTGFEMVNPLRTLGACNLWVPSLNYGTVESAHSYYLHMVVDRLCEN